MLFSKGNVDENGKATIVDPNTNRPIYINDGFVPQVEAFASKYVYNKLTIQVLRAALAALNEKAEDPQGNKYVFICNEKAYNDIADVLEAHLAQYHTDGTFMWSMKTNGYVNVGARGFDTYRYQGNEISFKVDRTFSIEFGSEKGYMMAIDLTADKASGKPAVAAFTLKGGDMMESYIKGVKDLVCAA